MSLQTNQMKAPQKRRFPSVVSVVILAVVLIICGYLYFCTEIFKSHVKKREAELKFFLPEAAIPPKQKPIQLSLRNTDIYYANMTLALPSGGGSLILKIDTKWAPLGAKRFRELVESNFFDNNRFFRVLKNFVAQFGINGDPAVTQQWKNMIIQDDPSLSTVSNKRGTVTFAHGGKNTRVSQIFINLHNNAFLDAQGFPPFAEIIQGLDAIDKIYNGYGEGGKGRNEDGRGPSQGLINQLGNKYLNEYFPKLSYIISARILPSYIE